MGLSLPYPDLVDRDTSTPEMRHIALTRAQFACGAPRDPGRPLEYHDKDFFDCVVCHAMWDSSGGWDIL
jgi:hypothetical protein